MYYFKKFILSGFVLMLFIVAPLISYAQANPCTDPADPCPIDGGVSLLIAAGIGIAAKKAYDRKKQKQVSL
jgi:hypothetical protein